MVDFVSWGIVLGVLYLIPQTRKMIQVGIREAIKIGKSILKAVNKK